MPKTALATRTNGAERWADRICTQLGKSVEAILEVGRLLTKAKADLPHGEWGRMFNDELVPFGQNTASKLMAIAGHSILSNSDHGPNLPTSWRTLYELTKADRVKLKDAIKDGIVTPDMTRKVVAALLPPKRGRHAKSRASRPLALVDTDTRPPSVQLYFRVMVLLSDELDKLAHAEQAEVLDLLSQAIHDLKEQRQEVIA